MVDGKLRFVTLPFTTTLLRNQPYETTNPVYLDCLDLVAAVKANSPTSMQALFSEGGRAWTWPVTERALVNNMFFGLALCFPVAFFVLLFATNNVIVSFFAILSIAAIVTSVLGFCRSSMGWDLGVAESIAAVIVIGFSVDYTVHLGHVYCESKAMTRAARMTDAATDMGVTVMGGAVTTMGAGLFMYGCQMTFFTKMATLITMTIVFSVLYSLGFFMSLCAVMGPVNGYGDVTVIVQWLKDKVRGKKE
jgi:predicted RND superfamily exporter protein